MTNMTWQDFGAALGLVLGLFEVVRLLSLLRTWTLTKGKERMKEIRQRKAERNKNKPDSK
jgi:hypothetical protein